MPDHRTAITTNILRHGGQRRAVSVLVMALLFTVVALPIITLVIIALTTANTDWSHLIKYVLPATVWQTFALLVMVAIGSTIIGAGTAWLTTMCNFPARRAFAWLLVLPLAVPTYIAAYSHVEFFDFTGPVQTAYRGLAGFTSARDYWFPDIRSLTGAGLIFSLVLYPYVFLACKLIFSTQGASTLDVSRSLGASPFRQFWKIGLPIARPAIAAGVALALMETLNDIGAVEILGVKTFSYAIYETWLNRDNLGGAIQLSLMTLLVVAALILLERTARKQRSFSPGLGEKPPARIIVSPVKQMACIVACATPVVLGLGIPVWINATYAFRRLSEIFEPTLLAAAANTLLVATLTALLAIMISYGILQFGRLSGRREIATFGRIVTLGYAVPGTVLAIGLLIPLAGLDNWLDNLMQTSFGISTGLWLSGSIAILIYACTLRFLAIAYGVVDTGFTRISPHIDMAARALGRNARQTGSQIHLPILTPVLAIAFLMVFVDTTKELSATLLLRPFDFETLATFVYDKTSQSAPEEAAIASLLIIMIGFLPIFVFSKFTDRN